MRKTIAVMALVALVVTLTWGCATLSRTGQDWRLSTYKALAAARTTYEFTRDMANTVPAGMIDEARKPMIEKGARSFIIAMDTAIDYVTAPGASEATTTYEVQRITIVMEGLLKIVEPYFEEAPDTVDMSPAVLMILEAAFRHGLPAVIDLLDLKNMVAPLQEDFQALKLPHIPFFSEGGA